MSKRLKELQALDEDEACADAVVAYHRVQPKESVPVKMVFQAGTAHFAPVSPVPKNWSKLFAWSRAKKVCSVTPMEEPQ